MRWSLPFLLFLLPLGGLAGKHRRFRTRLAQCKPKTPSTSKQTPHPTAQSTAKPTAKPPTGNSPYNLVDTYRGQNFFQTWSWWDQSDPTGGNVNFLSLAAAQQANLSYIGSDGALVISADPFTKLQVGQNRNSIRITSNKAYNNGLFIADIAAMPVGCSLWPAYWSVGPNWPNAGEIDVIEGVNLQTTNQVTLHTGDGCTMPQAAPGSTQGNQISTNCVTAGGDNSGCAFVSNSAQSYGDGFNSAGGGVYAHLLATNGITVYFFPRSSIPSDITAGAPQPSGWGTPLAFFPSTNCDIPSHFNSHNLVFDITMCGQWAGAAYGGSGCPGSCIEAVADPSNFQNAMFKVNYIKVYQ